MYMYMASFSSPVGLLASQAMQAQVFNVKGASNVKKKRIDCGEEKEEAIKAAEVGSEDIELAAEELSELLVCHHLLSTAPHLAREFAETWSPSLGEIVADWQKKESKILVDRTEENAHAGAWVGVPPEERAARKVVLGYLLKTAPHLAEEWANLDQGPTLLDVVCVWNKTLVLERSVRPHEKERCDLSVQPTLARKLSLMARQDCKPKKDGLKSRRALDKSPYFARSHERKWVAPPGFGPDPLWHPPLSPFHLVEECLYDDPWRLLVGCIFLNKTTAKVAVPIMDTYFSKWGTPEAASAADDTELCELLKPMGLQKKRAQMLIRFSREYLEPWSSPARDLHGIGKYGEDAWRLFCCGDLSVQPTDKELQKYLSWYRCSKPIQTTNSIQ